MDFPGEKLAIRMWDTLTEKGIGGILRPWQLRREGKAVNDVRREEMLALAQAEQDVLDIRVGRKALASDGRLFSSSSEVVEPDRAVLMLPDTEALAAAVTTTMVADVMRREINLAKALLSAEAELEASAGSAPDSVPGDDWLFRWRDAAGQVSEPELQRLWGSLLAGEFKAPGSHSLRTVEFVRNLTTDEALQISKLARFRIRDFIYRAKDNILENEGVDMGFLLSMQALGLISGVEAVGSLTMTWSSTLDDRFEFMLPSNDHVILVGHDDPQKKIIVSGYMVTRLGRQVMSIGRFEAHQAYLRSFAEAICAEGFEVVIADIVTNEDGERVVGQKTTICTGEAARDEAVNLAGDDAS